MWTQLVFKLTSKTFTTKSSQNIAILCSHHNKRMNYLNPKDLNAKKTNSKNAGFSGKRFYGIDFKTSENFNSISTVQFANLPIFKKVVNSSDASAMTYNEMNLNLRWNFFVAGFLRRHAFKKCSKEQEYILLIPYIINSINFWVLTVWSS